MQIKLAHILLLLFLTGTTSLVFSQEWSPFTLQDKPAVRFSRNINLQTNTVPTDFAQEIWQGNYINRREKTDALEKLQTLENVAQFENNTTFQMTFPIKDSNWIFSTRFKNESFRELSFSKTAFELAFFGNESSIGQKVPLEFHYREIDLMSMQLGIHYKNKNHIAGIALGAVSGSYLFDFELNNGHIYTQEDLSAIEISGKSSLSWSDSKGQRNLWKGTGINTNIYYGYKNRRHQFYIMLDDFGIINFQNNNIRDQTDSTWQYSGVNYNIFEQDEVLFNINRDSVQEWTNLKNSGNKSFMLPSSLRFGLKQHFKDRNFFLNVLGKYYFYSFARPELKIMPGWQLNQNWKILASLSHGGYSSLNAGLHLKSNFENGWRLEVGSNNLAGMWFNNHPAAADFYITITKY